MKERAAAVARSPFGIMSRRLRAEDQASAPACRPADNAFQAAAARAAPAKGAAMNTHNCDSASPPSNRAGAIERAGFTDVR